MSSESTSRIYTEIKGAAAHVIIENPAKLNSLSFDMWDSLPAHLSKADNDPDIKVIIVQGAGIKAFASGSDISQFGERRNTPEGVALYNATVDRAVKALGAVSKPTLARVNGYCFGGGLALAIHCDLRYASEGATFCIPAAKVGLGYNALWLARLTWLVGPANAKEIMYTSGQYTAADALRMGLINRIHDDAEFTTLVDKICSLAPLTHVASKVAIDEASSSRDIDMERCNAAIATCFASADYVEGRSAFSEKRKPVFSGR